VAMCYSCNVNNCSQDIIVMICIQSFQHMRMSPGNSNVLLVLHYGSLTFSCNAQQLFLIISFHYLFKVRGNLRENETNLKEKTCCL